MNRHQSSFCNFIQPKYASFEVARGFKPFLWASIVVLWLFASFAFSQDYWTLQTLAVPDTNVAYDLHARLAAQGFDVYLESTYKDNQLLLRVRLGCFSSKEIAQRFADHLEIVTARDMVVLPFTQGSSPQVCVENELGFLTDNLASYWGLQEQRGAFVTFWVYVSNQYAYLTFDSLAWQLYQRPEEMVTANPSYYQQPNHSTQQFRQTSRMGLPCIEATLPNGQNVVLTTGQLLWQFGNSAVIQHDSGVYSYRLDARG